MFKFVVNITKGSKLVGKVLFVGDLMGLAKKVEGLRRKGYSATSFVLDEEPIRSYGGAIVKAA